MTDSHRVLRNRVHQQDPQLVSQALDGRSSHRRRPRPGGRPGAGVRRSRRRRGGHRGRAARPGRRRLRDDLDVRARTPRRCGSRTRARRVLREAAGGRRNGRTANGRHRRVGRRGQPGRTGPAVHPAVHARPHAARRSTGRTPARRGFPRRPVHPDPEPLRVHLAGRPAALRTRHAARALDPRRRRHAVDVWSRRCGQRRGTRGARPSADRRRRRGADGVRQWCDRVADLDLARHHRPAEPAPRRAVRREPPSLDGRHTRRSAHLAVHRRTRPVAPGRSAGAGLHRQRHGPRRATSRSFPAGRCSIR